MLQMDLIGKKVTLLREGKGKTVVEIEGTITAMDNTGLLTIEHPWGVCYDRMGSKTLREGSRKKRA